MCFPNIVPPPPSRRTVLGFKVVVRVFALRSFVFTNCELLSSYSSPYTTRNACSLLYSLANECLAQGITYDIFFSLSWYTSDVKAGISVVAVGIMKKNVKSDYLSGYMVMLNAGYGLLYDLLKEISCVG